MELKILNFSIFGTKSAFSPKQKAGMDATITDESFATILSNGSAQMLKKSIDLINFCEETSFLRPLFTVATADFQLIQVDAQFYSQNQLLVN